jgi:hypothetical protein
MEHVAIDLGGRESQICIRNGAGEIVLESRVPTMKLREVLDRPRSRVILETCSEAFAVADLAQEYGHDVRVVPASLVKSLGVGARRTKTDRRDAQVLSEVSCRVELPSVHVPSHWSREAKSLCGMRRAGVVSNEAGELGARVLAASDEALAQDGDALDASAEGEGAVCRGRRTGSCVPSAPSQARRSRSLRWGE